MTRIYRNVKRFGREVFSMNALRAFVKDSSVPVEAKTLRLHLEQLIFLRIVLISAFLGVRVWKAVAADADLAQLYHIAWPICVTYALSALNALWLRHADRLRNCAYVQLGADVLLATGVIYLTGTTISLMLYLFVVVGAAIALGRNGALMIASFAGLCFSVLASGLLPLRILRTPPEIFIAYTALIAVAFLSAYIAQQIDALRRLMSEQARHFDNLKKQQQLMLDDISDGVITVDLEATVTSINQAARAIIGISKLDVDALIGKTLPTLLRQHGVNGVDELLLSVNEESTSGEVCFAGREPNEQLCLNYTVRSLRDNDGALTGQALIFDDVSLVRKMEERLSLHNQMRDLLANTDHSPLAALSIPMIGESPVMRQVFNLIRRVAKSEAAVLITGDSGTGKELVAQAIHRESARAAGPFIAINCGAIPENLIESELFGHKRGSFTGAVSDAPGLFRQAEGGTIFLDEVGELPLHLQTKLLRVLQEKRVRSVGESRDVAIDVRVIAATNRDLKREIQAGKFREDLYYRLNVVNIPLPSLRDRREDIPHLVRHFVQKFCGSDKVLPNIDPAVLDVLMSYPFPGNIRELENIIERAMVLGGSVIMAEHLPEDIRAAVPQLRPQSNGQALGETQIFEMPFDLEAELAALEKRYLLMALEKADGIKTRAAELLGLNFRSFRYRLKKLGVDESTER